MKLILCFGFIVLYLNSCHRSVNNEEKNSKPCEVTFVCPEQPEYITGYSYFSDDNEHRHFVGKNTATTLNIDFHKLRNTRSGLPINYAKLLYSFENKKDSLCCLKVVRMYNGYYLEDYLAN